ncbi:extracellular serine-rich [Fusarium longipes]|uniref:Extracellular serine-rich n=1 Tax=Fusarium longipes TaxID=694270 RepID=A0A395SZR8_9HYPO|nr:extracellular serine-rich [Fusarium longipes]
MRLSTALAGVFAVTGAQALAFVRFPGLPFPIPIPVRSNTPKSPAVKPPTVKPAPVLSTTSTSLPVVVPSSATTATSVVIIKPTTSTTSTTTSTTSTISSTSSTNPSSSASSVASAAIPSIPIVADLSASITVDSTVLILGKDDYACESASSGLQGYGIPFEKVLVPKDGFVMPTLNSTSDKGNYGSIIIVDAASYQYDSGWASAITQDMWNMIFEYQLHFNVRLVRINEFPNAQFGVTTAGDGCCSDQDGTEPQLVSLTSTSDFPSANLKADAGLSTKGIYHYPATITDPTIAKQIARFGPGGGYTSDTVAGVINKFTDGREQLVWFLGWAHEWSPTTAFLNHAHVHWMTRGVFVGKRKVHLNAQIDDVQLSTGLYYSVSGEKEFKIRTDDLNAHVDWQYSINARLPKGSEFWLEFAHNGNGDIIGATAQSGSDQVCVPNTAVDYVTTDTPLEWVKPPGTGTNKWSDEFVYGHYPWSQTCAKLDNFASWFLNKDNLNHFAHVSHTFTHLELNNATYQDASREIDFNRAWMKQMGIDQAARYSPNGLVPPAITGLHNADVIQAWLDNKITFVVGDNTRPVLQNQQNPFWPLISTVESNGYNGLVIIPRFATTIYYNCDSAECTTKEWIDTSSAKGDFSDLIAQARVENSRHLLSLHADPYMFHQANMRVADMPERTVGNYTARMSLVTTWVETVTQELMRLTDWPITSIKHDDIAQYFLNRKTLDACNPRLSYGYSADGKSITHVTVSADNNSCSVPVPVTVTGGASVSGAVSKLDILGSEPAIQWVQLTGSPVKLTLASAIAL